MIIYACLARCLDSMPLSATDALSKGSENLLQESKRAVKLLSKQVSKFPPKLCIQEDNYTIHCVKDETTCFFVVCDPTYPHILAYSFLDELMKEFSLLYTPSVVNAVKRPFGFIEFDSYLHKVQQKYNSPRTLASRLNIPDLTNDINLNPPVYKKLSDYEGNNFKNLDRPSPPHSTIVISNGSLPNGILKNHIESDVLVQMRPIPWYGRIALILVIPCMLLDAYRGIVSLHAPSLEGSDETAVVHGCSFLFEMIFLAIQAHYLRKHAKHRRLIALNCLIFAVLLNILIYDIREGIVILLYSFVSISLCVATFKRTFEKCLPNLNI